MPCKPQNRKKRTSLGDAVMADALRSILRSRLEVFREYTLTIENKFKKDKNNLLESYKKELNISSSNSEDYLPTEHYAELFGKNEEFLAMVRYSTLVLAYSFLEYYLERLCNYVSRRYGLKAFKKKRGKDTFIEQARKYLEEEAGIDVSQLDKLWEPLQSLNIIRNCIVHDDGNIQKTKDVPKRERIENIISETNGLFLQNEPPRFFRRLFYLSPTTTAGLSWFL